MLFNKLIVTLQSEEKKLSYYVRKFEIKEDRVSPAPSMLIPYYVFPLVASANIIHCDSATVHPVV